MANIYNMIDTWNDGATTFTAIKMDVDDQASASGSLLMDLQVGGTSKFKVDKTGDIITAGDRLATSATFIDFELSGLSVVGVGLQYLGMNQNASLRWTGSTIDPTASATLALFQDAANTLAQRNSTNAQTFNLYNTYTDASNYERGSIGWNINNNFEIKPEKLGTGQNREMIFTGSQGSYIRFKTDNQIDVSGGGALNTAFKYAQTDLLKTVRLAYDETVATLPASPAVGMISRVTDGDSGLTFGNTVVNSGAGATPYLVWYNGTNWTVIGA